MDDAAAELVWDWEFSRHRHVPPTIGEAYRSLREEVARRLAARAVTQLEATPVGGPGSEALREPLIELVVRLACFVPGVLSGLHRRLVEQRVPEELGNTMGLDPYVVFHQAEASARDRLLEQLEAVSAEEAHRVPRLLLALAWVGDDEVRAAFTRWAASPPSWTPAWVSEQAGEWLGMFPTSAGWAVGGAGERRNLVHPGCRVLVEGGEVDAASVGGLDKEHCQWCGGPLTVLFDLDLADGRLSFLGLSGDRLRVPTCEFCVCYATVYIDVDLSGGARWSDLNIRPTYLPDGEVGERLAAGARGLGDATRSPLEVMAFGYDVEVTHVGGVPTWIQDGAYPSCGRCGELMPFLGQVDTSKVAWGEGTIYAFLDARCGVAATLYQQT